MGVQCMVAHFTIGFPELAVEITGSRGEDDSVCTNRTIGWGWEQDFEIRAYCEVEQPARVSING
jgi:hypothetical protein